MKKKGLLFYSVAVLTVLSAGFCIITLKQSLVGAAYHEYEAEVPPLVLDVTPDIVPTASPSVSSTVSPIPVAKPTTIALAPLNPQYPARLIIPSLAIDAFVQETGLTKTGAMGIPTNFTDVAWYKDGAIPGETGNAVIDGHVDNALALPGVFKHLGDIQVGDDIFVKNKKGEELHFMVSNVSVYEYNKVPTSEIFGTSTEPTLRLITCGGTWVKANKTYDRRTVVTAKLAS